MSEQEAYRKKYRNAAATLVGLSLAGALVACIYSYNAGQREGSRVAWAASKNAERKQLLECRSYASEIAKLRQKNGTLETEVSRLQAFSKFSEETDGRYICDVFSDQCEDVIIQAVDEALSENNCQPSP